MSISWTGSQVPWKYVSSSSKQLHEPPSSHVLQNAPVPSVTSPPWVHPHGPHFVLDQTWPCTSSVPVPSSLLFWESSKAMAAWTPALCIVSMLLSARSQQVRRKGLISNICHVAQTLKDPQPQSYTQRTRHILSSSFYGWAATHLAHNYSMLSTTRRTEGWKWVWFFFPKRTQHLLVQVLIKTE